MEKKLVIALVLVFVFSIVGPAVGALAFPRGQDIPVPPPPGDMPPDIEQHLKSSINKLVTAGTITQDQADKAINYLKQNKPDKIIDYLKQNKPEPSKNHDLHDIVNGLKNAVGLTDEQVQAIADVIRLPEPPDGFRQRGVNERD